MDDKEKLNDIFRHFKISVIILSILFIIISVGMISGEIPFNHILSWPKGGYFQLIMILVFISPAVFGIIKFQIQRLKFVLTVYLGKQLNYTLWSDIRRIESIINQEDYIEYYKLIREQFGEHTCDRIIRKDFIVGDSLDIIILSLGYPQFAIHYFPWLFVRRDILYYFPFYGKKKIFTIFNIKFKYKFVFQNDKLIKVSMDDFFKPDKYEPTV